MVGEPAGHVEEFAAPGGPVVGHGGLEEMSRAVQLVPPAQVLVALTALDELEPGVEVAVGLLRARDQGDDPLHLGGESRVVRTAVRGVVRRVARSVPGELPGRGLQPLVDVRVHERVRAPEFALGRAGGEPQIVQVPGGLQQTGALRH